MLILSIDTTGGACSAALIENEKILCEQYLHDRMTHSQNLMPLVDACFGKTGKTVADVDAFAVVTGPGSFTGVRIGVCAAKGFAQVADKPIIAIDTLELLAQNVVGFDGIVCPILDARRNQVYTAFFRKGERLCDDFAADIADVAEKLRGEKVLFLGDGVPVLREKISAILPDAQFAPEYLNYQHAGFAAAIAARKLACRETYTSHTVLPNYLRDSQAEQQKKRTRHES